MILILIYFSSFNNLLMRLTKNINFYFSQLVKLTNYEGSFSNVVKL